MVKRQNMHHTIVDLYLQLVDPVLLIQHAFGKLLVGIQHGMHRLMHGALRQAAHPQQPLFQFVQISLEVAFHESIPSNPANVGPYLPQSHPKRPVIYASVRASPGVVNNCGVGLNSINCPVSRNAVKSLTRAACCMLCVTITIVQRSFNCTSSSSIFSVLMGSSAEHGSCSKTPPGSTPTTRAIPTRSPSPPDRPTAEL